MEHDDPDDVCLLSLPRPVLGVALRCLPLEEQLRAATCCKLFHAVLLEEVLPFTEQLQLLQYPGAKTARALAWLCSLPALPLKHLALQGAVCQDGAQCLSLTEAGRKHLASLQTLQLQSWKKLNNARLESLLLHCASLQRLEFSDCKVDDAGLGVIASCTPHLQHLDCSHCRGVTDDGVSKLALGCRGLKSLVLDGVIHCTDQTLALLALYAKALEQLSVAKCFKIGDTGIQALCRPSSSFAPLRPLGPHTSDPPHLVPAAAAPCSLGSLSLSMCPRVSMIGPLRALPQLHSLDLTGCVLVDDQQLLQAVSGVHRSMRCLRLNNCMALTGQGIVAVAEACRLLEVLCVRGVGMLDPELQQLAHHTRHLRELNLNMCHAVTDQGLAHMLASNPRLQRLEVEACYLLTDAFVRLLPRCTPSLAALNVRMCNGLSSAALLQLVVPQNSGSGAAAAADADSDTRSDTGTDAAPDGEEPSQPVVPAVTVTETQSPPTAVEASDTRARQNESSAVVRVGLPGSRCSGCPSLSTMHLGGVLSELETTQLVRRLKAARPHIVLRV